MKAHVIAIVDPIGIEPTTSAHATEPAPSAALGGPDRDRTDYLRPCN
jgi:hypothetical protein